MAPEDPSYLVNPEGPAMYKCPSKTTASLNTAGAPIESRPAGITGTIGRTENRKVAPADTCSRASRSTPRARQSADPPKIMAPAVKTTAASHTRLRDISLQSYPYNKVVSCYDA